MQRHQKHRTVKNRTVPPPSFPVPPGIVATDRCGRKRRIFSQPCLESTAMIASARLLCLLLVAAAAPASAGTAHYALDPVHTRVVFAIDHAGYSKSLGSVSGSSGTLEFDPDDWTTAKLEATVPLQRLDLGDADWNRAALDMLDAKEFPEARFVSTRVEPVDAEHASVFGDLTLHGVTREVKLDVAFNQLKRLGLPPFHRIAGFSATATLSRAEFGIDAWKSMVGDEVQLRFEVEAVRKRRNGDGTPAEDAEPAAPETPEPAEPAMPEPTP